MACGNKSCTCGPSILRTYNANAQTLAAAASLTLTLAGETVVKNGEAITLSPAAYGIVRTGIYHVTADVDVTATAAGAVTLAWYLDGVALPCTQKLATLAEGSTVIHTETDLGFPKVCPCSTAISHTLTLVLTSASTAAGTATVCAAARKVG